MQNEIRINLKITSEVFSGLLFLIYYFSIKMIFSG